MVLHKDNAGRFWLLTSPISSLKLIPLLTWNWSDLASRSSEAPLLPLQLTPQLPRMDFSLGITSLVITNMPTDGEDQANTTSRCRSWRSVCCWVRRQRAWQALWGGRPGLSNVVKIIKSVSFPQSSLEQRYIAENRCWAWPWCQPVSSAAWWGGWASGWSDTGGQQTVGNTICNDFRQRNKKLCLPFLGGWGPLGTIPSVRLSRQKCYATVQPYKTCQDHFRQRQYPWF